MARGIGRLAILVALVALGACSPSPPSAAPPASVSPTPGSTTAAATPASTQDRVAGWRSDLATLVPGMDRLHPDLGHGTPVADLNAAVASLLADAPTLTDDQLMVGVLRVVAMVSARGCDAHTGAFIWGTGTYPVESLPLRLWLFPTEQADSLVIVDALPPYQDLIGSTIDTIDGVDEAQVRKDLASVVPRDNDWTVRLLVPRYVLIAQVLRGLGIVHDGPVSLGLTTPDGSPRTVDVQPIPMAGYNAWAGPYGLHLPADPNVQYLSKIDEAIWWAMQPDGQTLYVQYNRVDHLPLATLAGLRDALHGPAVNRVVLDLRHNFGGEVSALDPILADFDDPAVDQPGRLFVITGRNTFSAASLLVARLDAQTEATIVGEPMGGCPTSYGNPTDLTLPFSGIVVSVAGMLEVAVSATDTRPTIVPDIPLELSREEWANGGDPALGAITTLVP
jgi:hypothetical protein